MIDKRRLLSLILILTILLIELSLFITDSALCNQKNFSITGIIVRSSSGSQKIYPGSRRVSLRIEAAYLGNETARSVTGNLKTVNGIDFSAGSGPSAPARSLNGSLIPKVEMGDYVIFDYYLDISETIQPKTYTLTLNITYRLEFNTTLLSETHNIPITISNYPSIELRVVDAYLSPASSPGSVNTNLYVLMENIGESSISSADFEVVRLPSDFTINNPRARVGVVNIGERFTVMFSGVSVPMGAYVGSYRAEIYVYATMRTEDNVIYDDETTINVYFDVASPPLEEPIIISSIAVLYQGSPAPLLPSANGITIRVTLINRLPDAVSGMSVTPDPPTGIIIRSLSGTYVNGMAPGGSCFIDMDVDVDPNIEIGEILIPLDVTYVRIVSGASYMAEQSLTVSVVVESYHSYVPELRLATAYWGSPNPIRVYSGSRHVPLTLRLINDGRYDIVGCTINASSAYLKPIKDSDALAARLVPGSYSEVILYFDINADTGDFPLNLQAKYVFDEFGVHIEITRKFTVYMRIEEYPAAQLRVIEAYLNPISHPGSINTNLYVVMENAGKSSIMAANFNVSLPQGFTLRNPRTSVSRVDVGERFTLQFSGMSVPQNITIGIYSALIYADLSMRTEEGVYYNTSDSFITQFEITEIPKEEPIMVSSVSVLYQGSPAPLLPSAKNVVIRLTLVNKLPEAVGSVTILPNPPEGINIRSISGTYVEGMPPGSSCFADMSVDVDEDVRLGRVYIPLKISFVRILSDSSFIGEQNMTVSVVVESPHAYIPDLKLVSAYWGSPNPIPVYSGSQYVPLTLRFINDGRYDIVGGVIRAVSDFLRPIKGSEVLAARLTPGSYSSVTLYFDVNADAGEIPLNVLAEYVFDEFGVHLNVSRDFEVYLPVEAYSASASNLMVISFGWQNNYNVFPGTENTAYQVTFTNRSPFSIGGILLSLYLPENFSSNGGRIASAYIEGPIRSLGTFTSSFRVSVGNVQPGRYNATLTADFILMTGGPGIRCLEEFNLTLSVNDDSQAVEYIGARWYEGSVGPNTYGAHLIISIRNNYVDSMKGVILELNLPKGMLNALDNTSHVRVSPLSASIAGIEGPAQIRDLSALISTYLSASQISPAQTYSRGDLLTFLVSIHVLNVSIGIHNIEGSLSYIDQWGTRRSVKVTVSVPILGGIKYIDISTEGSLSVRSRFANISLAIRNVGSSPIYDVYLIISPHQGMPILIASPTVTYISVIGADETIKIPVTLAYNPMGFMSQIGGATMITYGPVPLMISMVYRDASGSLKSFNNTITVVVEPFIDLLVKDVSATGRTSSTVSGIIINYGSATAYRVRAVFQVGGTISSALVGDIAPGDEAIFKVEAPAYNKSGILRIEYYNVFDELIVREMQVSIVEQPIETPTTPTAKEGIIGPEMWIVVAAVIVFLSFAAFLIYRALRARSINRV